MLLVRGFRSGRRIRGKRFIAVPLEIPLLEGKTVRDCIYKFLDNGLLNGTEMTPENQESLTQGLEADIDQASRFVTLVNLVNNRAGRRRRPAKLLRALGNRFGAIAIRTVCSLQL